MGVRLRVSMIHQCSELVYYRSSSSKLPWALNLGFCFMGGRAFTRTLKKEGKKNEIFQSLGVDVWMSMGAWAANYGTYSMGH